MLICSVLLLFSSTSIAEFIPESILPSSKFFEQDGLSECESDLSNESVESIIEGQTGFDYNDFHENYDLHSKLEDNHSEDIRTWYTNRWILSQE